MLHALKVLMLGAALNLSVGGLLAVQAPTPRKASPPKTVRLYVFDCGMLTISTEGVTRYHVTPSEVGESRMPVPCFLVAHPRGTLLWDCLLYTSDAADER